MVVHVFFQLQIHKKLCVCLTVYKVLYDDVIWSFCEVLSGDGFDLHCKVEVGHVFEGNGRHSDLVFLGWDFDHGGVFVDFVEFFEAGDFWDFAVESDGEAERLGIFELDFEHSIDFIVIFDGRYFDCNLDLSAFFGPDFKPDFLKVFVSFVASDREDVLIKIVELLVAALGDDSEEEGM